MLCGGDEIGRTQQGNNNGYCQDNELSWYDWEHADPSLLGFVRALTRLRLDHPVFCRRRWFQGRPIRGSEVSDIAWFTPSGTAMSEQDWQTGFAKSLAVYLNGEAVPTRDDQGRRIVDDSFYVMFNAHSEPVEFVLPESKWGERWTLALDTSQLPDDIERNGAARVLQAGEHVRIQGWALVLLRHVTER